MRSVGMEALGARLRGRPTLAAMTTFADVLARLLRRDAGRPLVTFYDHATGERTELSVTTYANWVAKTASLLAEEYDLERGQSIRIDLPTHWLGPVFLGAAWTVGLVVDAGRRRRRRRLRPGRARAVGRRGPRTCRCWPRALHPLGMRFADPLPAGVHDFGVEVWSQPDAFVAVGPAGGPTTSPLRRRPPTRELWDAAAAGSVLTDGGRLLTEENPASPPGISSFTEPLARGGSLVLVAHADPERLEATYAAERATARFPVSARSSGLSPPGRSCPSPRPGTAALEPVQTPWISAEVAGRLLADDQVRVPGRLTSLTPSTQSYGARSPLSARAR